VRRQAIALGVAAPALALALAACGGSSSSTANTASPTATSSSTTTAGPSTSTGTSSSQGTTLQLEANASGQLEFDKTSLEAPAGEVTIVMTNPSSTPHDVAIEGNGVDVVGKTVTNGGTSTVTADLSPGTYTFLCTVDSHADAGMKGTLTVTG
jgi:plastocyanin